MHNTCSLYFTNLASGSSRGLFINRIFFLWRGFYKGQCFIYLEVIYCDTFFDLVALVGWVLLYVHRNRRLIRDGSPGRPPRLSHSAWALPLVAWSNNASYTTPCTQSLEFQCLLFAQRFLQVLPLQRAPAVIIVLSDFRVFCTPRTATTGRSRIAIPVGDSSRPPPLPPRGKPGATGSRHVVR